MRVYSILLCAVACALGSSFAWAQEAPPPPQEPPVATQAAAATPAPLPPEAGAIDPLDPAVLEALAHNPAVLGKQADEAYQAKDYLSAAKLYLACLARNQRDSAMLYNLACTYGLLGEDVLAGRCLQLAFDAGYSDLGWAQGDPDFALVRGRPAFDGVMDALVKQEQERAGKLGELVFYPAQSFLPCRVLLPAGYDPQLEYPLIIALHGYGGNHEQFTAVRERLGGAPVIFAVPEAPYPMPQGDRIGFSWIMRDADDEWLWHESVLYAQTYLLACLRGLKERYKVGDVYLLGFSQGCGLSYMVGLDNPDEFTGLICFGGWLQDDWFTPERLSAAKAVRIFIAHGNEDDIVEFRQGTDARDTLQQLGYDVTFYEFAGGHRVPEEGLKAAMAWLAAEE